MNYSKTIQKLVIPGPNGDIAAIMAVPTGVKYCHMVILMHGFTADKDNIVIATMADYLLDNGIASIRFDFNGHGESEGLSENMTIQNEILDAKAVYESAVRMPFVREISFLGHSQGGVVASMLAGDLGVTKVKSLVLMSPAGVIPDSLVSGNLFGTSFDPENPPATVLAHNGFIAGRDFILTGMNLPIYETSAKYKGNVCILYGKEDVAVPYKYIKRYAEIYTACKMYVMPGLDHNFKPELDSVAQLATNFLVKYTHNN